MHPKLPPPLAPCSLLWQDGTLYECATGVARQDGRSSMTVRLPYTSRCGDYFENREMRLHQLGVCMSRPTTFVLVSIPLEKLHG